jgi:hypothetical protein
MQKHLMLKCLARLPEATGFPIFFQLHGALVAATNRSTHCGCASLGQTGTFQIPKRKIYRKS